MDNSILKVDQEIVNKHLLPGETIKTVLQTPGKKLRGLLTSKGRAIFISTSSKRQDVAKYLSVIASAKAWNLSISTEGSHLVCLLYP